MSFPSTKRVIYQKNPLVEVICQLRFPTILRIDEERPIAFHEAVYSLFPYYDRAIEHMHNVEVSDANSPYPNTLISHTDAANHTFLSQDLKWKLNLTSNFITLSTTGYQKWEEFKDCFERPLASFVDIYKPAFFNRIGLRYVDAIDKEALGLSRYSWSDLLNKAVIGMLDAGKDAGIRVAQCSQVSELVLDDQRSMVVRTGFGNVDGGTREVFVIDTDLFTTQDTAYEDIYSCLDSLHQPVNDYFHWLITDELHKAMVPKSPED